MTEDTGSITVLNRELYTIVEAARLLRVPPSTLEWWLEGRVRTSGERYAPVLRAAPTGSRNVTWGEFVEAAYLREYRRAQNVGLNVLRPFIAELRDRFEIPYPLAHFRPFVAEGGRLVQDVQKALEIPPALWAVVEVSGGQLLLTAPAESYLSHVEFSEGDDPWAIRLRPAGKQSPVVIDPEMGFGAPTVNGIRTEALAELVDAGEPIEDVANDYGLQPAVLKAALAYEWEPTASAPAA
jgi:uncharacterized protein (DUF433 family)